jgi:hypothetical protein
MAKILGTELRAQFDAGYLTSTLNRITRFTPEEVAIGFGKLLKYGTSTGHYEAVDGTETAAHVIAGVSVFNQTRTGVSYPGTITEIQFGDFGDCLIQGDVVVEVSEHVADAGDIVEGARVYLATDGLVSPDASHGVSPSVVNHLLLPQFIFTGLVETNQDGVLIASVRKLF